MISLAVATINFVEGNSASVSMDSRDQTSLTQTPFTDEVTFVSYLSPPQCEAFNLMSLEQRHEALETAQKASLSPDAAVDAIMNKYQLAVVEGLLKVKTSHSK